MSLRKHQFVKVEKTEFVVDSLNKALADFEKCADYLDTLRELNVDAQLSVDNSWETAKKLLQTSSRFDESITYGPKELAERKKAEEKKVAVKLKKQPEVKTKKEPIKVKIEAKPKAAPKLKKQPEKIDYAALKKLKQNLDTLRKTM